jgi:mono/diheme cytochrome c family protein
MRAALPLACLFASLAPLACGGGETDSPTGTTSGTGSTTGGQAGSDGLDAPVPADEQRPGDPKKGYAALINNGYVSCGVPYTAYKQAFAPAPEELKIPGRNAANADIPYDYTRFTTTGGVDVVSANCLQCHAGFIKGKLIIGLGNARSDFTINNEGNALDLAQIFLSDPKEKAELTKFADRVKAIAPHITTKVVGVNPADNLATVLFAHRDRKTLAWSDEPLLDLPPADMVVPVDVPPWWRMAKKNAMFYVAAGRGDHARIEMTASTLCTDSVDEAKKIDAYFPDIAAYIASIEPPKFTGEIDASLVGSGQKVFKTMCSTCHGTYGQDGGYPNLVIALDKIGTDPVLASSSAQFVSDYIDWFNESFYGEIARLEPLKGYIAPPLDGVWATAPYLHNGSVPTIEALLDSSKRPKYWSRKYDEKGIYDDTDYDDAALGWNVTVLDHGWDKETDTQTKLRLYDTTLPGYSNAGHTFGDALSDADRRAVIEYLKTL